MDLVAVIDIGKTNKKVCLVDRSLKLVAERSESFVAESDGDGFHLEPTDAIWAWLQVQLAEFYREHGFQAIAITTHGATYALAGADGRLTHPVVAYDTPLGDAEQADLDSEFYDLCGPLEHVQEETASCDLPLLINPAKSLLYLKKRRPEAIRQATTLLNYPQYWGWRLTGVSGAEATYTANHSFLFDPRLIKPSSVAKVLGVEQLIDCSFQKPWDQLGTLLPELQSSLGLPPLPVALGIHDSNAALLPYLLRYPDEDFVLNSTGTWCVAMHRVDALTYAPEELGQKVLYNIDALGHLQKVSFLMGGQDYALYHKLIGGSDADVDLERLGRSLADPGRAFMSGAFPSQFPGFKGGVIDGEREWSINELAVAGPDWFADAATAHDLLNASLAIQTKVALERTGTQPDTRIFVEGGFRNNPTYLALLSELFPQATLARTSLQQATAVGTALLAWALVDGNEPADHAAGLVIEEEAVEGASVPALGSYAEAWLDRVL
jgi:sugar (pentulose or hexulose) kinase